MFEGKNEPLLERRAFFRRVFRYSLISFGLIFFSLAVGILGYHGLANFSWADSFLNAAMIMGGMGPVNSLTSESSKIFAGFYALYCGLVLLISVGVMVAPIAHRILHRFHLEAI